MSCVFSIWEIVVGSLPEASGELPHLCKPNGTFWTSVLMAQTCCSGNETFPFERRRFGDFRKDELWSLQALLTHSLSVFSDPQPLCFQSYGHPNFSQTAMPQKGQMIYKGIHLSSIASSKIGESSKLPNTEVEWPSLFLKSVLKSIRFGIKQNMQKSHLLLCFSLSKLNEMIASRRAHLGFA